MSTEHLFVDVMTLKERHFVKVRGEMDRFSSVGLTERLGRLERRDVVMDLSGVTFIDAAGVTALVGIHDGLFCEGHRLRVVNPRRACRRILELARAGHLLQDGHS